MKTTSTFLILLLSLFLLSCSEGKKQTEAPAEEIPAETAAMDAEILFDGSSLDAWRNFKTDTLSHLWKIEDGTLTLSGKGGGDIVTRNSYESFELELEWKISPNGNSGIFFHVSEADSLGKVYLSGPEIQILDNDGHPDGKIPMHRAGDNYDLQACSEETVKPVGEWNQVKVVVHNGKVEQWLNGTMVVSYTLNSPEWEEQYQKSKFTEWPAYGRAGQGHIALQDHGDPVWFRNITIKKL